MELKRAHALNRISTLQKEVSILRQSFQLKVNQSEAALKEQQRLCKQIHQQLDVLNEKMIAEEEEGGIDFTKNQIIQP